LSDQKQCAFDKPPVVPLIRGTHDFFSPDKGRLRGVSDSRLRKVSTIKSPFIKGGFYIPLFVKEGIGEIFVPVLNVDIIIRFSSLLVRCIEHLTCYDKCQGFL
jgi:hypothetical protein